MLKIVSRLEGGLFLETASAYTVPLRWFGNPATSDKRMQERR